jgi:hypothetical protein
MSTILGNHEYCYRLGLYLKDFLNKEYVKERTKNTELSEGTIVKTVKNYDSIVNNLAEFPLLKLYRTQDQFKKGTNFRISTITLTYSLSHPDLSNDQQAVLPDLIYWVGYKINEGLRHWDLEVKGDFYKMNDDTFSMSYMLNASEILNTVYPFIRCSFRVRDHYMICQQK